MTREEAIKELQQGMPTENATDEECERYVEAYNMAIKTLEQESSDDAISRQSVLSKIKEVCFSEEWVQFRVDKGSNGQRDFLINYIEQLSTVTPQPKMGCEGCKFEKTGNNSTYPCSHCSRCYTDKYKAEQKINKPNNPKCNS